VGGSLVKKTNHPGNKAAFLVLLAEKSRGTPGGTKLARTWGGGDGTVQKKGGVRIREDKAPARGQRPGCLRVRRV